MAQQSTPTGQKRGPGRPPKNATLLKKQKAPAPVAQIQHSPAVESPVEATSVVEKKVLRLPSKVTDGKPLPTLCEPLPPSISDDEYQSVAASTVLPASLDRSRLRWVHDGVFQRYWVKPETGKHAKPPPPNNPEVKWMKHRGQCRIRIEPHIFECEVYVEEKTKPQPPPKQYVHANTYVQPYRPPIVPNNQPFAQPYNQSHQNRSLQPGNQNTPPNVRPLPPVQHPNSMKPPPLPLPPPPAPSHPPSSTHSQQPPREPSTPNSLPNQQPDRKSTHDPVISMLASRASSDPELKALMKEVATGNASQDQLRIFQRHIDELTAIIQKQKKEEAERAEKADAEQQRANVIQYDGAADGRSAAPKHAPPVQHTQQPVPPRPYQPPPPPPTYRQPTWTPPAPASLPVIIGFTTPGASDDRFLFPQHSILESLSPQHTLVSFIVARKGREAVDTSGLDPEKEYWQPITMMVEVAYGREEILACVRRWVKPAEEVRKHMEEVMNRCERAPQTYLALRLPFRSTAIVEVDDTPKEGTPVTEEKSKSKSSLKQMKKGAHDTANLAETVDKTPAKADDSSAKGPSAQKPADLSTPTAVSGTNAGDAEKNAAPEKMEGVEESATAPAAPEAEQSNRSRRSVRKSVRISEG